MNKELEEAINILKKIYKFWLGIDNKKAQAIETVLTALENSIPKQVVEKYLKEEKERFNVYKRESKENENLKLGMWKHLGAKNMCERLLGIEKTVTLDLLEGKQYGNNKR